MRELTQKWHNDVLKVYQALMFETLVYRNNITSESVKVFTFENEKGKQIEPLRGYLASKEINGKICKYFIDEEIYNSMPIRVNDYEEFYLRESSTKKSIWMHPINPNSFNVKVEKTFETTRQMIDEIAPFNHSNPDSWTLLKIIGVMGVVGKLFLGISSKSEFGKSGLFKLIHGITQLSITYQPRTEAGMLIQINEVGNIVFDEVCNCEEKVKKLVGGFTLQIADNSPTYVNGAIKAKFLKQIYSLTEQSLTFLYNTREHYDEPKNFFDNMFENAPAIHSRILKLKFEGILQEGFRKDFNIPKVAEDNKFYYIKIHKHILWLKMIRSTNAYVRRYANNENIGRHGLIYDEITWLIDMYCHSEEEYKKFIGVLDKAIKDYREMVGQQPLISQSEQNTLGVEEEIVEEKPFIPSLMDTGINFQKIKIPPLMFIKANSPKGEISIDDFLNNYTEKEMNLLLERGDIFQPDNKTLKILE